MQHRTNLSTSLLIVLAANKRRRRVNNLKPRVAGIKVDKKGMEIMMKPATYNYRRVQPTQSLFTMPY